MTAETETTPRTDAETVAALQRAWIFGWDKTEGVDLPPFADVFGRYYDFDADVIFFDDADPERRVFRRVGDYADAFWPTFSGFRSAKHAIAEEPAVLVSGDLAAGRMVFIAVLTLADGTVNHLSCQNSHVWQRDAAGDWHIVRDQTTIAPIDADEAEAFFA
jgi:ketosteroid isomerase-like protein